MARDEESPEAATIRHLEAALADAREGRYRLAATWAALAAETANAVCASRWRRPQRTFLNLSSEPQENTPE